MEIFSNLPEELQGVVMSYARGMWKATPAQLLMFKTCEHRHQLVRPYYLHMLNSPQTLPRALAPRTLKGCVGPLPHGYMQSVPLPRQTDWRATSDHEEHSTSTETINIEPIN